MLNTILIIGAILILAILVILFRISNLVDVVKGTNKKRASTLNKINAALMMVFLIGGFASFWWYSTTYYDDYTLPVASEHGVITDGLFWTTMWVTGIVFIITHILLFWYSFRYQYKEKSKAFFYPENHILELAWTVIPAIVLALLVFTGLKAWNGITSPAPENAEVVEIMGHQFAWKVRYPGKDGDLGDYDYRLIDPENGNDFGMDFSDKNSFDDFTPIQMVLPKGKPVLFKIRARDVLHSVFAPHFRLKMDAVPGMPTRFWFVPTKTTEEMRAETGNPEFNYEIACTEICGKAHFSMRLLVEVLEEDEYNKWYASQKSWLSKNPDYLSKVPTDLKELAMISAGIEEESTEMINAQF